MACVLAWLGLLLAAAPVPGPPPGADSKLAGLPEDVDIEYHGQFRQTREGEYEFTGPVTITSRGSRIQANHLQLKQKRYVEADGEVLLSWEGNRIFGAHITYDLETELGTIDDASGEVEGEYLFWAERVEKVGKDRIHLEHGTVTTCTQPLPYWSFAVSSATIRSEHYARMWNARLRALRMPILYLPYLVYPVKRDRALGLLFPELHSTARRGRALSEELFVPLGRSADLTLLGRYYTEAGFGGGGEARFIPNRRGSGWLNGFFIPDKVAGFDRYRVAYRQEQTFLNGFRLLADVNVVSDFNYYSDFERELSLVSSPTIQTLVELARNGSWTSLNIRELRRRQLFLDDTELRQETLPEIEFRGRSHRLGKLPLYLSYESSLTAIRQRGQQGGAFLDADYVRGDAFPTLSLPWSPLPWLDVTPQISYRLTYYTQHRSIPPPATTSVDVVDRPLTRSLLGAGVSLVGPKLFHIYERPNKKRLKHSIEPRVTYGFQQNFERIDEILRYDEIDSFGRSSNAVTYSVVQRLFGQRPQAPPPPVEEGSRVGLEGGATSRPARFEAPPPPEPVAALAPGTPPPPQEPVEIASLEVRQSRSFDTTLSSRDNDGDRVADVVSHNSPIELVGRYNPSRSTSVDLRGTYQVLYDSFSDVSVSGSVARALAQLRFSLVFRNGLGLQPRTDGSGGLEPVPDDTQLRLTAGFRLLHNRLRVDLDGLIDADPTDPSHRYLPDKSWRVSYATQCCAFTLERLNRSFATTGRDDFYFRVDLSGIGKILDLNY
ncbi:MAG TPA: LPS assembly protein LptD [Candidatus Polarisedimenticolaceae bacterium]|nr:LPS assembly protein LptD [Candidatus Polarisedimenticolaceae bacterium]